MERRNFLKSLLATSLATPFLFEAKTSHPGTALYLINDTPEVFLPSLLKEILPPLRLGIKSCCLDMSHPKAEELRRALKEFGWTFSSQISAATMRLFFQILRTASCPSFTLTRLGRIQDVRTSSLFRLWKQMHSSAEASRLLTIASLSTDTFVRRRGQGVTVFADGKRWASFSLDKDRTEAVLTKRGQVVIAIESGKARVVSSTCPHQICRATPPVCYAGERIVCAPKSFFLEVEGPRFVDTITG